MVIVFIRTTLRAEYDRAAYEALNVAMFELIQTLPGFLAADDYRAPTGAGISVVRFASLEALAGWREHPDHVVAQQRGRAEFYASYSVEVCQVVRAYDHTTSARR